LVIDKYEQAFGAVLGGRGIGVVFPQAPNKAAIRGVLWYLYPRSMRGGRGLPRIWLQLRDMPEQGRGTHVFDMHSA
jgi:hypothetical protein